MKYFLLFMAFFLLNGCAEQKTVVFPLVPVIQSPDDGHSCDAPFPKGEWSFVHSIDFTMKGGSGTTVIGVTSIHEDLIRSALVTIEGFTLFEAMSRGENKIEVLRAVPPFDKKGFAGGMMADIRAIFQLPSKVAFTHGQLAGGDPVCRYTYKDGGVVDILFEGDDCWQRKEYSDQVLIRSIIGKDCRQNAEQLIPEHLVLQTFGNTGYTLKMTLISADKLP